MLAELPRPGVDIIQEFRTQSPTIVTPTLVACIVGLCRQVVDVVVPSSSGGSQINPSALVALPAFFLAKAGVGTPPTYNGLDSKKLVLSVNNSPDVEVEFKGSVMSPTSAATQITSALLGAGITEAVADTVSGQVRVRTLGVGEFQSIEVRPGSDAVVLSAFGLTAGYVYEGTSTYAQGELVVPVSSFPDPRKNISEVAVEANSVRVFLNTGAGLRELSRTQAVLRAGNGGAAATLKGVSLVNPPFYGVGGLLDGKSLTINIDKSISATVTFSAPANAAHLLQQINTALGGVYATDASGLTITSKTKGAESLVSILESTAAELLGFTETNAKAEGSACVAVMDDGNGDAVSPIIRFVGEDFTASAAAATCVGVTPLTGLVLPQDLQGTTLTLRVSGKQPQTLTFGAEALPADVAETIGEFFDLDASLTSDDCLRLRTKGTGEEAHVEVLGGTATGPLGLVPSLQAQTLLASVHPDYSVLEGKKLSLTIAGSVIVHTFVGLDDESDADDVVADLNTTLNAVGASADLVGGKLRILAPRGGKSETLSVGAGGTAHALLGLDAGQRGEFYRFVGAPFAPRSGDELYVDGRLVGRVLRVAPGNAVSQMLVDKQLPITAKFGARYHIVAKGLGMGDTQRPSPELTVSGDGTARIRHEALRNVDGTPMTTKAPIYLSYRGVRQDVTARAKRPGLLTFDGTEQVESLMSPMSSENPLALGLYFALLNAPNTTVMGLGVDEISADSPYGTVEAFQRAFEFLEAYEVAVIAPMTSQEEVGRVLDVHVTSMSLPENRGERFCYFHFPRPAKHLDKVVASGANGNAANGTEFDTGVSGLSALVLSHDIDPMGAIPASAGLFLDIQSNDRRYSIERIDGSVVTIRTLFAEGDNDDGFYSETPLPNPLINEGFSVRVRGASLVRPDGTPDKWGMAEAYQNLGKSFGNRRFRPVVGDAFTATVGGLEQSFEGFYLTACKAGMVSFQPPQQSLTNFPMIGPKAVSGTHGFFTTKQLNAIAAGGISIITQDAPGAAVIDRMALTSDMTSVETRTDSVNNCLDFTAKFLRGLVQTLIGKHNITKGLLDTLSLVAKGGIMLLSERKVIVDANLNNIIQDPSRSDGLLLDITVELPKPFNNARLTLIV